MCSSSPPHAILCLISIFLFLFIVCLPSQSHRVVLSQRSAALKRHLQDHARSTNSSLLAEAKAQLAAVHKGGGGSGGGQLRRMLASMVGAGAGGEELDNR